MRAETTKNRVAHLGFVVNMRPVTGRKKDRGGEKNGGSRPLDYSVHKSSIPPFADNAFSIWRFSGIRSSAPPCLFIRRLIYA